MPPQYSKSWLQMKNRLFSEIISLSSLPGEWVKWKDVDNMYARSLLKPINMYVHHFGVKPEIISLTKKEIVIRQYSYSDIYIVNYKNKVYCVDKPWLRQFYPSEYEEQNKDMFLVKDSFRAFMPWIIDEDMDYFIKSDSNSFYFKYFSGKFTKGTTQEIKNSDLLDFYFLKNEEHLVENGCTIIPRGTYMYDIYIYPNKKVYKNLKREYDKKK
jgi:hypothetical protein